MCRDVYGDKVYESHYTAAVTLLRCFASWGRRGLLVYFGGAVMIVFHDFLLSYLGRTV